MKLSKLIVVVILSVAIQDVCAKNLDDAYRNSIRSSELSRETGNNFTLIFHDNPVSLINAFGHTNKLITPPDSLLSFNPAWDTLYKKYGVKGCFVLQDKYRGSMMTNDWFMAQTQKTPASTFKILNSLISLETAVIPDQDYTLKWDSVNRTFPNWNRDHDLRSAYKYSVVWYYQELARRVGADTMKFWLDKVSYGNADTSGGIDQFWLTGNLRISPIEQILFLQKLESEQLPFSKNTITIVKDIMIQERSESLVNRKTTHRIMREQSSSTSNVTPDNPLNSKSDSVIAVVDPIIEKSQKNASALILSEKDYIIRWKTGWGNQDGKDIGWIVGYMEKGADVYYFANCIEAEVGKTISQENFMNARMEILQTILAEYK